MRESDLIDPGPGDCHYAINLFPDKRPERSKVGAAKESLMIDAPFLPWLGAALASRRRGRSEEPLLKMTLPSFVTIWKRTVHSLRISRLKYAPYQLRHGGPSHDMKFKLRTPLAIKMRGRWSND